MQNVIWPAVAKIADHSLVVQAHSRGGEGRGHSAFARAPGASFKGRVEIPAMRTADALSFRAFLHSLRGRNGTFLLAIPGKLGSPAPYITFTDDTAFSDGTTFADVYAFMDLDALPSPVSAGSETIEVTPDFAAVSAGVGVFAVIGDIATNGQLLHITKVSGTTLTVRPRVRQAWPAATQFFTGRVVGKFRLDQETPAVPLIGDRSLPLTLQIAEPY